MFDIWSSARDACVAGVSRLETRECRLCASPLPVNPYDAIPYTSYPFPQSHPARLATIARLFSLPAPSLETARVLEIGCAAGGNLIPLAYSYPQAEFVGVDYSRVQIDDGQELVDTLRLKNIDLRHADLMQVDASWGEFDFVLCHGVYSWVAPPMQEKILSIAAELLTPDGIAYVSYNAYPGWHMRGIVRQMMRFHALWFRNPYQQIGEARRVLELVSKHAVGAKESAYSRLIKQEAELLAKCDDHYIFHEHLETYCEPLYFHEFIGRAREHGLDYLGESCLGSMAPTNFGADAHQCSNHSHETRSSWNSSWISSATALSVKRCCTALAANRGTSCSRAQCAQCTYQAADA